MSQSTSGDLRCIDGDNINGYDDYDDDDDNDDWVVLGQDDLCPAGLFAFWTGWGVILSIWTLDDVTFSTPVFDPIFPPGLH